MKTTIMPSLEKSLKFNLLKKDLQGLRVFCLSSSLLWLLILTAVSSIPFEHICLNHNNPNWPQYASWNLNNVEKIWWIIQM